MKLYELTAEYAYHLGAAMEALDNQEDTEGVEAHTQLLCLKDAIEVKAENVAKFILSLKAEAEAIAHERDRLSDREASARRKAAWLRDYLLSELQYAGIDKVKRDVLTVSVRTNNPSIKVIDEAAVPHDWCRLIPETWEVNKDGLLKHIKATGEVIPGVEYVANKKRLEIR